MALKEVVVTKIAVKEKPILFNSEMVRAVLSGRKTQTRRVIKFIPEFFYGLTGDTIYIIHNKERIIYEKNNSGKWHCVGGYTSLPQQRLHGWERWEYILPNKIRRFWEEGIRGLVPAKRVFAKERISHNIAMSPKQESDEIGTQISLHGFPWDAKEKNIASSSFRRNQGQQQAGESKVGNPGRELDGSGGSRKGNQGGEASNVKIDRQGEGAHNLGCEQGFVQSKKSSENFGYEPAIHIERPKFQKGINLWVRETWSMDDAGELGPVVYYKSTDHSDNGPWKPSIHMPRKLSRINLEITAIRVERVQDISSDDCQREGLKILQGEIKANFATLWDSINKKRGYGWSENPWVWIVEFEVI